VGMQLPSSTPCVLRWAGAADSPGLPLSGSPRLLLSCAGDAADPGVLRLFLSLPPFIYQALILHVNSK